MTDPTTSLLDDDDDFEGSANPEGSSATDDFDDIDLPPPMVGLIRGHVSEVKANPRNDRVLIIELKSEEPESSGASVAIFIKRDDPRQRARLCTLAASCGLTTKPVPGGMRIEGGVRAMKNKPVLFVVETYQKDDGTVEASVAWGMPKPEKSPEWAAYAKAYNGGKGFTDEQVKAIKSGGGIIPADKRKLFE